MKSWYRAAELANLPGLPGTKPGIHLRAEAGKWKARDVTAKGGAAREYHIDSLPAETVKELQRRARIAEARKTPKEQVEAMLRLPAAERPVAEARLYILTQFQAWHRKAGPRSLKAAREQFAKSYNAGDLPFEADVYELVPSLSAPNLARWERREAAHGLAGLARQYGNRKDDGLIDRDPVIRNWIIAQIGAKPHISSKMLMNGLRAHFRGEDARELPSYRTLQRWVTNWKERNRRDLLAIADPDGWRSKYQVAFGSASAGIQRPNQLWEIDSSSVDAIFANRRHALIQVLDVATRRVMFHVAKTSTAAGIAALLRRAILDWGVPERIKMDNGRDYTSRAIESILAGLAIERDLCPPFRPEKKPHVERAFRTFQHSLVEILPGYIGHNVAERKAIESRRAFADRLGDRNPNFEVTLTAEEFQEKANIWADTAYAHEPHAGLNGQTPFEAAASYRGEIRRIEDERALDMLLLPASGTAATRVITKKGIAISRADYTHPALGALVGETVSVLTDPTDLGHIYVFDLDGAFLCEAENPIRTGISAQDLAAKASAIQKEATAAAKADIRKRMRGTNTDDLVRDILIESQERAGRLVRLPQAGTTHTTKELKEAGRAARAGDFNLRDDTEAETRAKAEIKARLEASATVTPISERQAKFDRAVAIKRALEAGQPVSDQDRKWFGLYSQSAEFKAQWAVMQLGNDGDDRRRQSAGGAHA